MIRDFFVESIEFDKAFDSSYKFNSYFNSIFCFSSNVASLLLFSRHRPRALDIEHRGRGPGLASGGVHVPDRQPHSSTLHVHPV